MFVSSYIYFLLLEKEATVCLWGVIEQVVLIGDNNDLSDKAIVDKNCCYTLIAYFKGFASGHFKLDFESLFLWPF